MTSEGRRPRPDPRTPDSRGRVIGVHVLRRLGENLDEHPARAPRVTPVVDPQVVAVCQVFFVLISKPCQGHAMAVVRPWAEGQAADRGVVLEDVRGGVRQQVCQVVRADASGPLTDDLHVNELLVEPGRLHGRAAVAHARSEVESARALRAGSVGCEMIPAVVAVAPVATTSARVSHYYVSRRELPDADPV